MLNIKNITLLKYGLIIVFLSIIINIIFYFQFSITETIFLNHIYYKEIQDGSKLDFFYIKNSYDNSQITHIDFPEMPENFAYIVLENNPIVSRKFTHYHCNKITMTFYITKNLDIRDNVVLTKGIVRFDNGKEQDVIFGEIELFKNTDKSNDFSIIDTSSSEDNLYSTTKVANKDISIEKITHTYYDKAKDIMDIKLNGKSVEDISFPINISKGGELTYESKLITNENDKKMYNVYNVDNCMFFTTSDGRNGYEYFNNISYNPFDLFTSEKDIIIFLKYKGAK